MKPYICWLTMFVLFAGAGCTQAVGVRKAASLPEGEVATILGGGLPNLRSVDQVALAPDLFFGKPDVRVSAGSHTLSIDYQPCWNSNLCGLATAAAEVVLQPGQSYEIRHRTAGCSLWLALTAIGRSEPIPCRNFLWLEDRATGQVIWGETPSDVVG